MSYKEVLRNIKVSMSLNERGLNHFNQHNRPPQPYSPIRMLTADWSLDSLDRQQRLKNMFTRVRGTRYPIKLLRYWFMCQLLVAEAERLDRPLRVCEIGVDQGQMRLFARDAGFVQVECWDAVDVKPRPELNAVGYDSIITLNAEDKEFRLERRYDVVIALHLLEHLHEPEAALGRFSGVLAEGGLVIGGYPVTLQAFEKWRESHLRRNARPFHHVSVFSPARTVAMATINGLSIEFLSGAFLMRRTGWFLENFRWWARFNLFFGATFPSLGGELYWSMRKN